MVIKIDEFQQKVEEIKKEHSLSNKRISEIVGVDYTYLFRIFKDTANPGKKFIDGIERFCKEFSLDSKQYIFLEQTLPTDNESEQ